MPSFNIDSMGNFQQGLQDWDAQRQLYNEAPGVALPPSMASAAPQAASSAGGGMGMGAWSTLAGGLVNSVADAIDGYTEMKRYQKASQAASDADVAQTFARMAAYIQDQQLLQEAISKGSASKAFDPGATGAEELKAASAPMSAAAARLIGDSTGAGALLAQRGLENRATAAAVDRQMGEGSRRAMRPLQDFFTEAGDRRASFESLANMANRYNQANINAQLASGQDVAPITDVMRLAGTATSTAGLFI